MTDLAAALAHLKTGDWQAAHTIVQADESPLSCWAHGIVHLMEGDRANAAYWYRRAERSLSAAPVIENEVAALEAALGSAEAAWGQSKVPE